VTTVHSGTNLTNLIALHISANNIEYMIISVFSSLFSIIVAFWVFSILDFWLIYGCVLYEGKNVFFKILTFKIRGRLIRGEIR